MIENSIHDGRKVYLFGSKNAIYGSNNNIYKITLGSLMLIKLLVFTSTDKIKTLIRRNVS